MEIENKMSTKALVYVAEAEKLKKGGLFRRPRFDEAYDKYIMAANCMKMENDMVKTANLFEEAAICAIMDDNKYNAIHAYIEAGKCVSFDTKLMCKYYTKGIEICVELGKFGHAAKHHKELAEAFEKINDFENCVFHLEKSAYYYETENMKNNSNNCKEKIAHILAQNKDGLKRAISIFEELGNDCLNDFKGTRKYFAKKFFFKAGICYLCFDAHETIDLKIALEKYCRKDYTFNSQREYKLLISVIDAIDNSDISSFSKCVAEYNGISPMENWDVEMFLIIKRSLQQKYDVQKVSIIEDADDLL